MSEFKCVKCGNTSFVENASFCKRCGTAIQNTCNSTDCGEVNAPDASYCEYCGSETIYNTSGVIEEYSEDPELPF